MHVLYHMQTSSTDDMHKKSTVWGKNISGDEFSFACSVIAI